MLALALGFAADAQDAARAQMASGPISSTGSHGKLCVDVPGGFFKEGIPVRLYDCHRAVANQLFDYDPRSKLLRVGGLCLSVFAGPLPRPIQDKDQVGLLGCDGGATQRWFAAKCDTVGHCTPYAGPEPAQIAIGDFCLSAPPDIRPGKDLTVERCADGPSQQWQLPGR